MIFLQKSSLGKMQEMIFLQKSSLGKMVMLEI